MDILTLKSAVEAGMNHMQERRTADGWHPKGILESASLPPFSLEANLYINFSSALIFNFTLKSSKKFFNSIGDIFGSPFTATTFEEMMKDFGGAGLGFGFLDNIFGDILKGRGSQNPNSKRMKL
jgi:hypothetical protein